MSEAEDTFGLIDINASSDDYMLGVRYNTPSPVGHLYAGGGWVYADAEVNAKGPGIPAALRGTHSGSGSGYWLGAGVVWDLGNAMTLGFDATMTDGIGDIDMGNGIMADVESTTLAVTLGIRF